jgi:type I restriction enzyme, S subunit
VNALVLGESLEVLIDHRGKTPKKLGGDFTASGVPVASALSVRNGRLDLSQPRFVPEQIYKKWMPEPTRRGDVLLTSEAPAGRVARVTDDSPLVLGQRLFGLRGREGVLDSGFLYYALQSDAVQQSILGHSTGTTVVGIRQSALRQVRIPAPLFAEQVAIAEVLGALDDKIAANTTVAVTTRALARTELRAATLDSAIELPISEVVTVLTRGITPRYVGDGNGMRVLNQKCIRNQVVSLADSRWTDTTRTKPEKLLVVDDVLVNSTGQGTLGRVARWTSHEVATVDSHITIIRPDAGVCDAAVIGQAILAIEADIESLGEGSTGQTELSRNELGRARIRIPEPASAVILGGTLRALSASHDAALAENATLAAMRDALLPHLMSGKLRVRDAKAAVSAAGV